MRLATRLTAATVGLVLATAAAVGFGASVAIRQALRARVAERVSVDARRVAEALEVIVADLGHDALALRGIPEVESVLRQPGASAESRQRIADLLVAQLLAKPEYLQFRVIGTARHGREVVRVDRAKAGGPVRVVGEPNLQPKGDRDYFVRTLRLPPGEVDVSPIELNREGGAVERPFVPVVRMATPVYGAAAAPIGIIILNVDVRPILERQRASVVHGRQMFVVSATGEYIVHPDPSRLFGATLGHPSDWRRDFPMLPPFDSVRYMVASGETRTGRLTVGTASAQLGGGSRVLILVTEPESVTFQVIHPAEQLVMLVSAGATMVAIGMGWLLALALTRPLRELTDAVESFGRSGNWTPSRPGGGELGVLVRAFDGMVGGVNQRQALLQQETQERRDAEARFEILVDGVIDYAIVLLDAEGRIESWNRGAERLKGYHAAEIIGQPVSRLYTAEDQAAGVPAKLLAQAAAEGRAEQEGWRVRKDGSRFWADVVLSVLRDETGQLRGFAKITRDLTEPRRVAGALELERSKLTAAFDNANMGILLSDGQGANMSMNTAALSFHGYASVADMHEKVGEYAEEWELRSPDGRIIPFAEWPLPRAIRGESFRDCEIHLCSLKSGYEWDCSYTGAPVRNGAGEVDLIVLTLLEITERRRAEAQIQRLNAELEERVRQRTAQLEAANQELESFSYSVSHDLRAPLRAIDGFSRMVVEDHAEQLDQESRRLLEVVRANTQKMGHLIDDLLAFSRLGRIELRYQPTDMDKLVRVVFDELLADGAERARVELRLGELPTATADLPLMRQVWTNLLSNAVKYSRPRERAVIEVTGRREAGRVFFQVRDNGAGFDMQYAGKLFGVFQRLHSSREFEGTGVGLALVKQIVGRHGGGVSAEGRVGEGATFGFWLPSKEVGS